MFPPVLGDITALGHPDLIAVRLDVVEKLLQSGSELGVANCPLVQSHTHHLWRACATFLKQSVDRVLDTFKETVRHARHRTVRQVRVVVLDRVWDDEVGLTAHLGRDGDRTV